MIIVKIELHSALSGAVTEIGRMHISNEGKFTDDKKTKCNYIAQIMRRGTLTPLKSTIVESYPRASYSVWELVRRVLERTK